MSEAASISVAQNRVVLRILPFALIIVCGYLPVGIPLAALPLQVHHKLGFGTLVVGIVIGYNRWSRCLPGRWPASFATAPAQRLPY